MSQIGIDMYRLQLALRRLAATEGKGPRARRNARTEWSRQLRSLKTAVDRAYPPPKRKARTVVRTPLAAEKRLRERGFAPWGEVEAAPSVAVLSSVGIRAIVRGRTRDNKGVVWIPRWVRGFETVSALQHAKRSVRWREAQLAAFDAKKAHPEKA